MGSHKKHTKIWVLSKLVLTFSPKSVIFLDFWTLRFQGGRIGEAGFDFLTLLKHELSCCELIVRS